MQSTFSWYKSAFVPEVAIKNQSTRVKRELERSNQRPEMHSFFENEKIKKSLFPPYRNAMIGLTFSAKLLVRFDPCVICDCATAGDEATNWRLISHDIERDD